MHCLAYHVPFIIANYGNLGIFTGQAVEKLNDVTKKSTDVRQAEVMRLVEALKVNKRLEFSKLEGLSHKRRQYDNHNSDYWESNMFRQRASKKAKILHEISNKSSDIENVFVLTATQQEQITQQNEQSLDFNLMSEKDMSFELKKRGINTKVRKRDSLINMLKQFQK